jgi:phosphate transport system permease protein
MFIVVVSFILLVNQLLYKKITLARLKKAKNLRTSSLPKHYSTIFILLCLLATIFLSLAKLNAIYFLSTSTIIVLIVYFFSSYLAKIAFDSKKLLEKAIIKILATSSTLGIVITASIIFIIFLESYKFFQLVSPLDFFFKTQWNPQLATSNEPSVLAQSFGIVPVLFGTLLIAIIAMMVAVPIGILGAVYLAFYSNSNIRNWLKPILEILAGIPTIVYGYFAVVAVVPVAKVFFALFGIDLPQENAFCCGLVMGIMIIPFILSLSEDALSSLPKNLKDGALALGSTKSEMILKVALPSAMPSIISAIILATSRAIGETMIVVMSAGLIAKLSLNPFSSLTTATVQMVTLLTGDHEFNSPKTLAAFAIALTLFITTFIFNALALIISKKLHQKYS